MFASEQVVKAFESYVYSSKLGQAKTDPYVAFQLLELAHIYNIRSLERTLRKKFMAFFRAGVVKIDVASLLIWSLKIVRKGFVQLGKRALKMIKP